MIAGGEMTPRSFLTDGDRAHLIRLERRLEFWKGWGWKIVLAGSLLMVLAGFYLKGLMESAAQQEATGTVSAEEILDYKSGEALWFNERQAQIHNLYTLSEAMAISGIACIFVFIVAVFVLNGQHISLWRTVLLLERSLRAGTGEDGTVAAMTQRPSRPSSKARGAGMPYAHWFFGRTIKDPTVRMNLYRMQHVAKKRMRQARIVMWIVGPPFILIWLVWGLFPMILAQRVGIDWYTPVVLFAHQYTAPGRYHRFHLLLTDETWERLVALLLMLPYCLAFVRLWARREVGLRLMRELRRLDILLWRRVHKGASPRAGDAQASS